jgi:hypothetical protein
MHVMVGAEALEAAVGHKHPDRHWLGMGVFLGLTGRSHTEQIANMASVGKVETAHANIRKSPLVSSCVQGRFVRTLGRDAEFGQRSIP